MPVKEISKVSWLGLVSPTRSKTRSNQLWKNADKQEGHKPQKALGEFSQKVVRFKTKRSLWEPFWEGGRLTGMGVIVGLSLVPMLVEESRK